MPKTLDQPTAEMVIEAGKDLEDCPEIKRAFKKLWPGAFEEDKSVEMQPGSILSAKGNVVAWVGGAGIHATKVIILHSNFIWKITERTDGKGEMLTLTRK